MRSRIIPVIVAAALAVTANGAVAAPVVDQDQSLFPLSNLTGSSNVVLHSFRQAGTTLTGVSVMFEGSGLTSVHVLDILDNLPANSGNVLATGSASVPAGTGIPAFVFFDFATISVIPETELFFRLRPDSGEAGRNLTGGVNLYSRGHLYSLNGDLPFQSFDLTFQTFAESSIAVSAPQSIALMGFAVLSLAVMRQKRPILSVG